MLLSAEDELLQSDHFLIKKGLIKSLSTSASTKLFALGLC